MIKISTVDKNDFIETVKLDGVKYKVRLSWNSRIQQWYLDLRTDDNDDIVRGISVVPNFPMLSQFKRINMPKGELMAVCSNESKEENQSVPRNGFTSGRFPLIYVSEDELNAIQ